MFACVTFSFVAFEEVKFVRVTTSAHSTLVSFRESSEMAKLHITRREINYLAEISIISLFSPRAYDYFYYFYYLLPEIALAST